MSLSIKRPKSNLRKKRLVRAVYFRHANTDRDVLVDTRVGTAGLFPGDIVYIPNFLYSKSGIYMVLGLALGDEFKNHSYAKDTMYLRLCFATVDDDKDRTVFKRTNGLMVFYDRNGIQESSGIYLLKRTGENFLDEMDQCKPENLSAKVEKQVIDVRHKVLEFIASRKINKKYLDNLQLREDR